MAANDRNRITVSQEYASSLGRATFCFAVLEWMVVCCCERIHPGYMSYLSLPPKKQKTAGWISSDFISYADALDDVTAYKNDLAMLAEDFDSLVLRRNDLIHAIPCTALGPGTTAEKQKLSRGVMIWSTEAIDQFADDVTACNIRLNDLYYAHLNHLK